MRRIVLVFLVCLLAILSFQLKAQSYIDWNVLSDVTFENNYSEELGFDVLNATFGDWLIKYDGKEVFLSGYVIPLDVMGTSYVLSRNPNASCFFCGGAGPETIVELRLHPDAMRRYQVDEQLTFKGTLELNKDNIKHFNYVLKEAKIY